MGAEGLAVGTENECSVLAGIEDHEQEIARFRMRRIRHKDREMVGFEIRCAVREKHSSFGIDDSDVMEQLQPTLTKGVSLQTKSGHLALNRARARDTQKQQINEKKGTIHIDFCILQQNYEYFFIYANKCTNFQENRAETCIYAKFVVPLHDFL